MSTTFFQADRYGYIPMKDIVTAIRDAGAFVYTSPIAGDYDDKHRFRGDTLFQFAGMVISSEKLSEEQLHDLARDEDPEGYDSVWGDD
jgi:hypothetical protein